MAESKTKVNTIKSIGKKVANNGNANDYVYIPIGADSDNVDRPDGSTVEESLSEIEIEKVEIIPVEVLPTSEIQVYPFIYALVKTNESKGIFYEYRNGKWIKYGNGADGIWVGTKEECVKEFDNIEKGTIVIIVKKNEESEDAHTHDYVEYVTKAPTYSEPGIKTCTCFLCGESHTEEIPTLVDAEKPVGVIKIGNNEYATWKDTISFDTYYKDNQTVTIEASDNETGIKEIAYHLANTAVSDSNIGTVTWTPYTDSFTIEPNNNYIIYVKITDNSNNITYICSDGIVIDNTPPIFEGLQDGGTYPTGTVLTVEDGAILTVNGVTVELVNNTYTFTEPKDNYQLSLIDRAGNTTELSITIEHTHNFIDGICNECGKSEYEDFTLTINNIYMTGLTSATSIEDVELNGSITIPGTFEYDGVKYKTTTIEVVDPGIDALVNVTDLNLPDTVTNIKYINGFKNIKTINIPSSVKYLGQCLFSFFPNLKTVYFDANIEGGNGKFALTSFSTNPFKLIFGTNVISIPFVFNNYEDEGTNADCFVKEIEVTGSNTIIPNNTNNIGIFSSLYHLEKVILPSNLTEINPNLFMNCEVLQEITIPANVSCIRSRAFYNCTSLSVIIPDSVTSIESHAFNNVSHITYHGTATGSPWGALAMN